VESRNVVQRNLKEWVNSAASILTIVLFVASTARFLRPGRLSTASALILVLLIAGLFAVSLRTRTRLRRPDAVPSNVDHNTVVRLRQLARLTMLTNLPGESIRELGAGAIPEQFEPTVQRLLTLAADSGSRVITVEGASAADRAKVVAFGIQQTLRTARDKTVAVLNGSDVHAAFTAKSGRTTTLLELVSSCLAIDSESLWTLCEQGNVALWINDVDLVDGLALERMAVALDDLKRAFPITIVLVGGSLDFLTARLAHAPAVALRLKPPESDVSSEEARRAIRQLGADPTLRASAHQVSRQHPLWLRSAALVGLFCLAATGVEVYGIRHIQRAVKVSRFDWTVVIGAAIILVGSSVGSRALSPTTRFTDVDRFRPWLLARLNMVSLIAAVGSGVLVALLRPDVRSWEAIVGMVLLTVAIIGPTLFYSGSPDLPAGYVLRHVLTVDAIFVLVVNCFALFRNQGGPTTASTLVVALASCVGGATLFKRRGETRIHHAATLVGHSLTVVGCVVFAHYLERWVRPLDLVPLSGPARPVVTVVFALIQLTIGALCIGPLLWRVMNAAVAGALVRGAFGEHSTDVLRAERVIERRISPSGEAPETAMASPVVRFGGFPKPAVFAVTLAASSLGLGLCSPVLDRRSISEAMFANSSSNAKATGVRLTLSRFDDGEVPIGVLSGADSIAVRAGGIVAQSLFRDLNVKLSAIVKATPNDPAAMGFLAQVQSQLGSPKDAVATWEAMLRVVPNDIRGIRGKALAETNLGRYPEAIGDWNRLLLLNPTDLDALRGRAFAELHTANLAEAKLQYESVLALSHHDTEALKGLALTLDQLPDREAAVTAWKNLRALDDSLDSRLALARAMDRAGHTDEAIKLLDDLSRQDTSADALSERAVLYAVDGRLEDAIKDWTELQARARGSGNVGPSQVLPFAGTRLEDALQLYNGALDRDPGNVTNTLGKASVELGLGRYPEAERDFLTVLRARPSDTVALAGRATALERLKRFEEAAGTYNQILQQHPDDSTAQLGKIRAISGAGKVDEALGQLHEMIKANPSFAEATRLNAALLTNAGRCPEALSIWQHLIENAAGDSDALRGNAFCLWVTHDFQGSLNGYLASLEINSSDADAAYGAARDYSALNQHAEAAEAWRQVNRLGGWATEDPLGRSVAEFVAAKDYGSAIEVWDQILANNPADANAIRGKAYDDYLLRHYELALALYDQALTLSAEDADAHLGRARCLDRLGRNTEAAKEWQERLRLRPGDEEAIAALHILAATTTT
jgi:tetratricopeptide (TPR) repeat protein